MFNNLTYKKKVLYLLAGFVVLLILSYALSIRRTIALGEICNRLEQQKESLQNAPAKIRKINQELANINAIIGKDMHVDMDVQSAILEKTGQFCQKQKLTFKRFPKTHYYNEKDYLVMTNKLVMEGEFIKILKLIYLFEQEFQLGKIISVQFEKERDRKTKRMRLYGSLLIQNVKHIQNEN